MPRDLPDGLLKTYFYCAHMEGAGVGLAMVVNDHPFLRRLALVHRRTLAEREHPQDYQLPMRVLSLKLKRKREWARSLGRMVGGNQ